MRPTLLAIILATLPVLLAHHAAAQDAAAGQQVFKAQCSVCHSVAPGRTLTGPSLFGVAGRTARSVQGFHYSAANKASGIVWTAQTLDPLPDEPEAGDPGHDDDLSGPEGRQPARRPDRLPVHAALTAQWDHRHDRRTA